MESADNDFVDCDSMQLTFSGGSGQGLMLMTPQELEKMPDSGIEFEESVGPKENLTVSDSGVDNDIDTGNTDIESGTLATISISTDRDTDTTSIVINTKQGHQAFKINTTDLMQAAATLQPIMLADLVKEHAGEVLDVSNKPVQEKSPASVSPVKVINSSIPIAECIQDEKAGSGLICTHTGRCKKAWTCPECGKLFNKQRKLKVHMMMHAGCRPFKCSVDGCEWTFTSVYKLNRHQERHCSAKDYMCDFEGCNRTFTTVYNLNSHKKIHAQPRVITCPIFDCRLQFQTRRKMELHLREHKGVEAPYKCSVESCGKTYYTANSMASHLRVHKKNHLQCTFEGCNKVFDRMSRFKTHVWKHTGEKPYICTSEGCTWAFSSASKLKRHMRKHTGERQYKCKEPGCGKSFMRLEHLQGHIITHSGDKPFRCPHQNCVARFTAKSSLYVHLKKKHSEERINHICPVETCDKRYDCKSSLKLHALRYHSKSTVNSNFVDRVTLDPLDIADSQTIVTESPEQPNLVIAKVESITSSNEIEAESIFPHDSNGIALANQCSINSSEVPPPEIDNLSLLCVLHENNSGSARTDYCCNHFVTKRSRQHKLLQQEQIKIKNVSEEVVTSNDVVLTSSAFQTSDSSNIFYLPNPLLPDDPPSSHSELYQEDGLLSSMAKELAVPISLLTEQTNGHNDFPGTTINLQDLE